MKQRVIILFGLVFCLMMSMSVQAVNVTVDDISYSLDLSNRSATVTGSLLEEVIVPANVTYDGVTYEVTSLSASAFEHSETVRVFKSVSIKKIEESQVGWDGSWNGDWRGPLGAFAYAINLNEVYFENLERIGAGAFYKTENLEKVNIGSKVISIGSMAFSYCPKLRYVVIPSTVSSIYTHSAWNNSDAYSAFYNCTNLQIICLKEGIKTGSSSQTIYPSSFFTFNNSTFDYSGKAPIVDYSFNGIGNGFQPVNADCSNLEKNAGTHTSNLSFTIANDFMSFDVEIPYTYTINPIELTARVKDAKREYGSNNPAFQADFSGFLTGEDESVLTETGTFSTPANAFSDVGVYSISLSGAKAQNYTFKYEPGNLTVTKAPLRVTANNKTMTYGGLMPILDVTYEGLKNNETQPVWTSNPVLSTTAKQGSDVGTYPITVSNAVAKNYDVTTVNGVLTVTKVNLTIKAQTASRLYYENNPDLKYTCTGFVGNDDESVLTKKPQLKTSATLTSKVGDYPIEISGAEAKNYSISYQNGQLTIKKRDLNVTTNNYTRAYGEDNPVFELFYSGFVNNENEQVLVMKPTATTVATPNTDTGVYNITISGGVAENYSFVYTGAKLTIEKAYQTLSWEQDLSDIQQYAQVELTAEASSGLPVSYSIEGPSICSVTQIGSKQYLDCFGEGEVVLVAQQEGNKNYWQTTKLYKTVRVSSPTGVYSLPYDMEDNVKIYDVNGHRLNRLQKGINIIKMSDGTTRKVLVK